MTYRAGIVGCGGVSRDHCRGLIAARDVELVALSDVSAERLNAVGEAFGIRRRYGDYREMIAREGLDLVTVCTQAPQHAEITIAAAGAGVRGILCEKPVAVTLAEADRMLEACDLHGVRLAINHQTRMIPHTGLVEDLLRQGAIGDLRAAHLLDKGGRPAGNSLMELVTHLFDLLRLYTGNPSWVSAHLTVEDAGGGQRVARREDIRHSQAAWPGDRDCGLVLGERCAATFGFASHKGIHRGMTATLDSYFQPARTSTGERWAPSLELLGTEGILFLGGTSDHLEVYLHRGPWAPPGRLEGVSSLSNENMDGPGSEARRLSPYHTAMVEELAAAVEEGREHRSSGRDGLWALEMIMGIYESHRRGGSRVDIPLRRRTHPLQDWIQEDNGLVGRV